MRRYGASPVHLAAHAAAFALAGWAVLQVVDARSAGNVLLWFAGAVLLHDLLVLPAYSLLDRLAAHAVPGRAVNHVRIPAALSALLFAVWFPTILGRNDASFGRVAGVVREDVLIHWLALSAALFAGSAAVWLLRGRRAAARAASGR
jgi:hypothetical protein